MKLPSKTLSVGATVALSVALLGCSSDSATQGQIGQTALAESGSQCLTHGEPAGELCFTYDNGEVTVVGSGLAEGSVLTVTGASGDSANFDVGADQAVSAQVGARLILPPFTADGTWIGGDPASLTIDVAG